MTENVEQNEQKEKPSPLEVFQGKIAAMKVDEEAGEKPAVHFTRRPNSTMAEFNEKELTEEDMKIFEMIEDGTVEMTDWEQYASSVTNDSSSRMMFKNYAGNRVTGILGMKELKREKEGGHANQ